MQVDVHHASGDPADAVLKAGLEGIDFWLAMFLLPFNLGMLGMWIAIGQSLRHRFFRPVAGGAKLVADGPRLRVRLPFWQPLCTTAAFMGMLSVIMVGIVGLGFGMNPPIAVALVAWGVIPWTRIVTVELEQIEDRDSKGSLLYEYVPAIVFLDSDGREERQRLVPWWNAPSAEGLVEWLRERLRVNANPAKP